MKQKLFTLFFALVASVGTMFAESGTCGDNLTWDLTNGVLTISGTGTMTDFNWNGAPWYSYRESITEVSIGNSVTSIGDNAFQGCTGLTSITIPNSVTSIGTSAFLNCTGLISVTIPNSVTSIGDGAFMECTGMTSITIPSSVTSIGDQAFYNCTGLTTVAIPNSVTSIGVAAFLECTGMTSPVYNAHVFAFLPTSYSGAYAIPDGIESIAGGAFYYCTGLTSITIPNSVTSIGDWAFAACYGLTSVIIPNSVTSIGEGAFMECTGMTSITIPSSVTSIGSRAFAHCTGLTSVTIPNGITSIGEGAFSYCTKLEEIYNYATTPQEIYNVFGGEKYVFEGVVYDPVDKSTCTLYVPAGSIDLYKAAEEWKDFTNILPISAEEKNVDVVEVETSESAASIAWPQVSGAYTYELVIKDKADNIVCTLVFNAQGQLVSIKFNAPAQNGAPQHTQAAGFAFTITGLNSGSWYNYTLTSKNESGTILNVVEGTFRTQSLEAVDEVLDGQSRGTKFFRDGQVLIQKGDKTFDLRGQEVK